jgi:AcrR family transcriptional regulator
MTATQGPKQLSVDLMVKAAELFLKKGFEATSVNEISAATGLTKGGLYHYITGKRDLLYRIIKFGLENLELRVQSVLEISDPEQQLRALIKIHILGIVQEKGVLTAVTEEVQALENGHRREILATKRRYFDFVRQIMERLREQGRIRPDVDLSVATFNLLGMVLHFARWYRVDGRLDPEQIADQIANQTLEGVLAGQPAGVAG